MDEKVADASEGTVVFKNEGVEIMAFSWQANSANLYSLAHFGQRKETFICLNNIGLIERQFTPLTEREEPRNGSTRDERFNVCVNFNKPDKMTCFERLPVDIVAFQIDERQRAVIYGMDRQNHVIMDLRDRQSVKTLGYFAHDRFDSQGGDVGTCHVAHNGAYDLLFAKRGRVHKFDLRKASSAGVRGDADDRL